jgi:hypothetical protein
MSRGEVAEVLDEEPRRIAKEPGRPLVEQYRRSGVQAYFDRSGGLEFIELTLESEVSFRGVPLAGRNLKAVADDLKSLGLIGHDDGVGGYWYREHGFAFYLNGDNIEAVSVYSRQYNEANQLPHSS